MLNKVLDFDLPDLVVLNGDLITGENTFLENSTTYIDMIVGPMVERGLPWASTYGNHDHNHNISGEAILAREHMWPGARTRRMVPGRNAGITNYYLPVYAANCTDCAQCAPELLLWFFDSRGGFYFQEWDDDGVAFLGQPNWVDASVVEWFQQTNAKFVNKYQRTIPSLAFVHIPTNASLALQTQAGVDPNRQPGINDDYPLAPQAQGWCVNGTDGHGDPDCRYGGQDVPFMQAIATTPGLMAVFSGHDHGATWCYRWDELIPGMIVRGGGVSLCFGQHSGYGGYGNWIRGARQIIVDQDRVRDFEIDTYIRLESGAAVGSVTLNSTYNEDVYPATPNDMTYCPTCEY
jgi:hypothetical protein